MKELSLKEIQNTQLNILRNLVKFCDENGIRYFLYYGTLLGAIRHKGFIPWDNDIDIAMLRDDYDKFLKITASKDIGADLSVVSEHLNPFMKICDTNTVCIEHAMIDVKPNGLYIDIFPIDNIPDNKTMQEVHRLSCRFWFKILSYKHRRSIKKTNECIKKILRYSILRFLSYDIIHKHIRKNLTKYKYEQTRYVACPLGVHRKHLRYSRDLFTELVDVEFEGMLLKAPSGYHSYLTSYYGDYMTLPPPEKQVANHDFTAYSK